MCTKCLRPEAVRRPRDWSQRPAKCLTASAAMRDLPNAGRFTARKSPEANLDLGLDNFWSPLPLKGASWQVGPISYSAPRMTRARIQDLYVVCQWVARSMPTSINGPAREFLAKFPFHFPPSQPGPNQKSVQPYWAMPRLYSDQAGEFANSSAIVRAVVLSGSFARASTFAQLSWSVWTGLLARCSAR